MKTLNFSAGPSVLPCRVLETVQRDMLDFNGSGCSIIELSHRSDHFEQVIAAAEADLRTVYYVSFSSDRQLMLIPSNYRVLFMQGGGTMQFSCVPLNLAKSTTANAHYIQTGAWTKKAIEEAKRLGLTNITVHKPLVDRQKLIEIPADASYIYYCSNETVDGIKYTPAAISNPHNVPLVCDMSSDILTTTIDVSDYGLIFAGAQKNMGCAGVTTVIIREDLLKNNCVNLVTPVMLDYGVCAKNGSMYNTPSTFAVYVLGLVARWSIERGGMKWLVNECSKKGELVYGAIEASAGFYRCVVLEETDRSRANVVFRIGKGDEELEKKFLKEAEERGMIQLGGHRSVGGIRVSLYNAMLLQDVTYLVAFMTEFADNNRIQIC